MRLGLLAAVSAVSLGCAHAEPALPAAAAPSADACTRRAPSSSPFELAVLGSGGPASFGRAASGYVVFLDGVARALVDVGPGAFVRLGEMGVDLRRLDTFLVTHLHIDHSGDVPGVVMSRDLSFDEPLLFRFFGPRGGGDYPSTTAFIARLFGAQGAFPYLAKFRNTLKLDAVDLPTAEDAPIQEVLRDDDLHVTSVAVDHGDAPALAFRLEHAGHVLVMSGDLASKNDNLVHLAQGADLLVYDTTVLDPPGSPPVLYDLHTAPKTHRRSRRPGARQVAAAQPHHARRRAVRGRRPPVGARELQGTRAARERLPPRRRGGEVIAAGPPATSAKRVHCNRREALTVSPPGGACLTGAGPGLQNRCEAADVVSGRFDSCAPPPLKTRDRRGGLTTGNPPGTPWERPPRGTAVEPSVRETQNAQPLVRVTRPRKAPGSLRSPSGCPGSCGSRSLGGLGGDDHGREDVHGMQWDGALCGLRGYGTESRDELRSVQRDRQVQCVQRHRQDVHGQR